MPRNDVGSGTSLRLKLARNQWGHCKGKHPRCGHLPQAPPSTGVVLGLKRWQPVACLNAWVSAAS